MTDVFNWVIANWDSLLETALAVVGAASLIANFTKTDVDNKAVGIVSQIVHFLAANIKSGSLTGSASKPSA